MPASFIHVCAPKLSNWLIWPHAGVSSFAFEVGITYAVIAEAVHCEKHGTLVEKICLVSSSNFGILKIGGIVVQTDHELPPLLSSGLFTSVLQSA